MKIVARNLDLVPASNIGAGSVFRWIGKYYVSPCRSLRERDIWGVSLSDGCYISDSNVLVQPVDVEARVL